MKNSINISIDSERLSALNMYLKQKNIAITDEVDKFIESLYIKNVPQNVRDFIEMKETIKPEKKATIKREVKSDVPATL